MRAHRGWSQCFRPGRRPQPGGTARGSEPGREASRAGKRAWPRGLRALAGAGAAGLLVIAGCAGGGVAAQGPAARVTIVSGNLTFSSAARAGARGVAAPGLPRRWPPGGPRRRRGPERPRDARRGPGSTSRAQCGAGGQRPFQGLRRGSSAGGPAARPGRPGRGPGRQADRGERAHRRQPGRQPPTTGPGRRAGRRQAGAGAGAGTPGRDVRPRLPELAHAVGAGAVADLPGHRDRRQRPRPAHRHGQYLPHAAAPPHVHRRHDPRRGPDRGRGHAHHDQFQPAHHRPGRGGTRAADLVEQAGHRGLVLGDQQERVVPAPALLARAHPGAVHRAPGGPGGRARCLRPG